MPLPYQPPVKLGPLRRRRPGCRLGLWDCRLIFSVGERRGEGRVRDPGRMLDEADDLRRGERRGQKSLERRHPDVELDRAAQLSAEAAEQGRAAKAAQDARRIAAGLCVSALSSESASAILVRVPSYRQAPSLSGYVAGLCPLVGRSHELYPRRPREGTSTRRCGLRLASSQASGRALSGTN